MPPNNRPEWLSPLLKLEDFGGDATAYLDSLFEVFTSSFITTPLMFRGRRVFYDGTDFNGKPKAFDHITTETNKETGERDLCLRRCERIGWIKDIIENCNDSAVLVWEKEYYPQGKGAQKRTLLFLEQENFLIVLNELKNGQMLVTAIYVDYPNKKRRHLADYQEYIRNNP